MDKLLESLLPQPRPQTQEGMVNAIREIMQSLALLGLWRTKFFEHAAFYGGTALRILYGLDRFSEDLDFSLLKPSVDFSFQSYGDALQNELLAYGFLVQFETKVKSTQTEIESAFLKANTYQQLLVIEAPQAILQSTNRQAILRIKLEVDTNPPAGFDTELKYVFTPLQFAVRSYTLPSLFAGKMHALLFRKWKNRVKGRDWYDFAWYASKHRELNLHHLEMRMRQSGDFDADRPLSPELFHSMLDQTINQLNVDLAKNEAVPFISDPRILDLWSHDYFRAAARQVVLV
nr:nucleotidyl transferase AbiEii/AbiGii toxin family protein [Bacteroidota bacterium]